MHLLDCDWSHTQATQMKRTRRCTKHVLLICAAKIMCDLFALFSSFLTSHKRSFACTGAQTHRQIALSAPSLSISFPANPILLFFN